MITVQLVDGQITPYYLNQIHCYLPKTPTTLENQH